MNGNAHPAIASEAPPRPEDSIEIADTIRVACPLVEYKWRQMAANCPQCQHFHGLKDRFPGSAIAADKRYSVRCSGGIVDRQLLEIEA